MRGAERHATPLHERIRCCCQALPLTTSARMGFGRALTGAVAQRATQSTVSPQELQWPSYGGSCGARHRDAGANPAVPSPGIPMNRLERYFDNTPDPPHCGDYVVVHGDCWRVAVTHDVACRIRSVLDGSRVPRWIDFNDRVGSLIRVRTRDILSLVESTFEQRVADRRWRRARREEERADSPWDSE